MELSAKAREKAVEAFKQELASALLILRKDLASNSDNWKGKEHKMLLHRLKGGAGFLGYKHLTVSIAELEGQALAYPSEPNKWLEILGLWETESQTLS